MIKKVKKVAEKSDIFLSRKEEMAFFAIIQKVEDTAPEEIIRNDLIS